VTDAFGGRLELKPWERTSDRAVYDGIHVDERVEGSLRPGGGDARDRIDPVEHVAPAFAECGLHLHYGPLRAGECRERGVLCGRVHTGGRALVDLHHLATEVGRAREPPHPPARHRVGLRDRLHGDDPLALAVARQVRGPRRRVAVDQLAVHLVRENERPVVGRGRDDPLDRLRRRDAAGRVRRRGEHDGRRVGPDGVDDPVGVGLEPALGGQRDLDRFGAGESRPGDGVGPGRRRDDDLLAGVGGREDREIERLDAAGRDHHLRVGVDGSVRPGDPLGDGRPEFRNAGVVCVVRSPARGGLVCRLDDVGGRLEVRFAQFQVDQVGLAAAFGLGGQVEHHADPLGFDGADSLGDPARARVGRLLHRSNRSASGT